MCSMLFKHMLRAFWMLSLKLSNLIGVVNTISCTIIFFVRASLTESLALTPPNRTALPSENTDTWLKLVLLCWLTRLSLYVFGMKLF